MKTELQEQCTICYEILNSPEQITITKEILKNLRLLVQTINFTLLQHKPICEACLAKIKSACKFKTTYLDLQESFVKVKNEEDVYSDKPVYCEICKDIVNSGDNMPLFDPLSTVNKSIIINHFCPELESRVNENPQTCESCHKSMLNFCNITNLLSVFEQDFICDKNESESVNVKKELQQSDIASTSANSSEHCSVKDEVIPVVQYMKVEKDSMDYDEFIAKNEELDLKMDCEEESEEGNWTYGETGQNSLHTKMSCVMDEFKIKDKYILENEIPDKGTMFFCNFCEYKSGEKRYVNRHMRIHQKPDEIKMFQCNICNYKAKYKYYLTRHMLIHRKPEEIELFHCNKCDYKTKEKRSLKTHMHIHKRPDEIPMLSCELCAYKTLSKPCLKIHMIQHKKPNEIKMFQCKMCNFKTKYNSSLNQHMLVHKKPEEINMFQCNVCEYKAKAKLYLKRHMRTHNKPDETFQCATCKHKTIDKSSLKKHMLIHKKLGEVETFQCEVCEFNTKHKYYLQQHKRLHQKPEELEMFRCLTCEFETIHKESIKKHMLLHKTPDETEKFQCAICEFTTIHKCSLKKHMDIHKKLS